MNGESPMIFPVSGFRSGAPGMAVSRVIDGEDGQRRPQRVAEAACLVRGRDLRRVVGGLRAFARVGGVPRRPGGSRPASR